MTARRFDPIPYAAQLGAIVTICLGTSLAKQLFPLVGAEGTTAIRIGTSALMLLAFWRPWRFQFTRADLSRLALYGAVMGLMNLSFYMALRTVPLGLAIAIEFTGPLGLAMLDSRRPLHFLWIALAIGGLGLLLPIARNGHGLDPIGALFAFAAGLFWALYIVLGRRTKHLPAGPSVAIGMAVSALILVPVGLVTAGAKLLSPTVLGLGLVVGLFSSALPYSLEMIALRGISRRSLGVLLSAEPAFGALAGLALLGERLSLLQWSAIGLIIIASAGTVLTDPATRESDFVPPAG